jgi:cytoskeletal protein RodZ
MERHNNTYRALINNKFSELLSANSTKTWAGMKELLDKKMPEKKKRKWFLWFTTKAGIIAIVLFSLFASAAGTYIGLAQKKQENHPAPVQEQKNEIKKNDLKNDEPVNKNTSQEIINISPAKRPKASSYPAAIKNKEAIQTSETHKGKTIDLPVKQLISAVQNKDTLSKNPADINVSVKDSITLSNSSPQTDVTQRRRAF